MTRRDYELLARAIDTELKRYKDPVKRRVLVDFTSALCNELEKDSPKFDKYRFKAIAFFQSTN